MPAVAVDHCLEEFRGRLNVALSLGLSASKLYERLQEEEYRWAGLWLREPLAELGILRVRRSWEAFLERTFLRYLCGASTEAGYSPILLKTRQVTIEGARDALLKPNWVYLKWDRFSTEGRAQAHMARGEPYQTALNSVWNKLKEIGILRNRFAHKSDHTRRAFQQLVRGHYGYLPKGITPGRYLLESDPAHGGRPMLESYARELWGAAQSIVR